MIWHRRSFSGLRNALVIASAVLLAAVTATPLGADSSHASTTTPPFDVGLARCTFIDHTRSVLNYSTTPPRVLSHDRRLVTDIRYPTQRRPGEPVETAGPPPARRLGGYPMVVFAHGYDGTPETYAPLLDAWVREGFVVVAPFFPDEEASEVAAQHGANTEGDLANEPGDLAFVTRSILRASAHQSSNCSIVRGLIDGSEIALAGHSDGGDAVGMLAYDHGVDPQGVNFASLRTGIDYRAVIIMSGAEDTAQSYATEARRPDLLVVQSRADQCNAMRFGVQLYDAIHQSNKWFLELKTAHHLPPFDGVDAAAFDVVSSTTIRFLQMSLQEDASSIGLVATGNLRPTVARMFAGTQRSLMEGVEPVKEDCGPN